VGSHVGFIDGLDAVFILRSQCQYEVPRGYRVDDDGESCPIEFGGASRWGFKGDIKTTLEPQAYSPTNLHPILGAIYINIYYLINLLFHFSPLNNYVTPSIDYFLLPITHKYFSLNYITKLDGRE